MIQKELKEKSAKKDSVISLEKKDNIVQNIEKQEKELKEFVISLEQKKKDKYNKRKEEIFKKYLNKETVEEKDSPIIDESLVVVDNAFIQKVVEDALKATSPAVIKRVRKIVYGK